MFIVANKYSITKKLFSYISSNKIENNKNSDSFWHFLITIYKLFTKKFLFDSLNKKSKFNDNILSHNQKVQ